MAARAKAKGIMAGVEARQRRMVDAVRAAFVKALADPQAVEEAARQKLVITLIDGETLQALFGLPDIAVRTLEVYTTPWSASR